MLRPNNFGFNAGTKSTNPFQNDLKQDNKYITSKALAEFDEMVEVLEDANIAVSVLDDCTINHLPDAVFINNWITVLPNNKIYLFPMAARSRRGERRIEVVEKIKNALSLTEVIDLSVNETAGIYLEGTGSAVLDYDQKVAYGVISKRTNESLFHSFCKENNFESFSFNASDLSGQPIYHTNIILSITSKFVLICADSIENVLERSLILKKLEQSGKEVIQISISQVANFAGNCLEVFSKDGKSKLVMSRTGFSSLKPHQVKIIESFSEIVLVNISIIERVGGGGARCMMLGIPSLQ